jgi:hypothetical protein
MNAHCNRQVRLLNIINMIFKKTLELISSHKI